MAVESIAKTLGAGSGIDLKALVDGLVDAQFAPKKEQLKKREEALEAQISGVSQLRQTISSFDQALRALVRGGTLSSKLTSSDEKSIKLSALPGATPENLSTRVGVTSVASAQVSTTNTPIPPDTPFRTGTLTLRMGRDVVNASGAVTGFTAVGAAVTITIGAGDATLKGIAAKINAAGAGVTARIVTDGTGERLAVSGPMGADKAFEIAGANTGGSGRSLADLAVSRTSTVTTSGTRARDAVVTVDGVQYRRQTNLIEDLVPGARLELLAPSDAPVALGLARPTAAITEAVGNFVEAYNEMLGYVREANDPFDGPLRADNGVETLQRSLQRLTTATLAPEGPPGAPRSLAELGVATARDGTLSIDTARMVRTLAEFPAQAEKLFSEFSGLPQALGAVARQAADRSAGLEASATTYQRKKLDLAAAKLKTSEQEETTRARLTRQYATMDARTAAYKSTMTFMENQIKAWNRSDA